MRNWFIILVSVGLLSMAGCGNLSPQNKQKIDNANGRIGELESINQGLKLELGKLQNQADIQNSRLEKLQQGLLNMQSNNENSGVQIFSGPGGLFVACVITMGAVLIALNYRSEAQKHKQAADIMAQQIVLKEDPDLEDEVFKMAIHTPAEEAVYNAVTKHQRQLQQIKMLAK